MPQNEQLSARPSRAGWKPILGGGLKVKILEAIREIAAALPQVTSAEEFNPSLAGGAAGLAVLYAYLDLAEIGDKNDERAVEFIQRAMEAASEQSLSPALYGGFTGIAWAVEHLKGGPLDADEEDTNEAVDEVLKKYLSQPLWNDHYDLVSGLVGYGVYALERLPRPSAVELLERVVDRLDETAERNADGVTWHTPPDLLPEWQRESCPSGYYNLGLAHGVPGVIALLGLAWAAGVAREKARPLLDGAVRWLLAQRLPNDAGSYFASWVAPGWEGESSRVAWCYGDLGIVAALLMAARSVGELEWEREAMEMARGVAARPPDEAGVVDACLCHGAAGVGHIFNRLFQATGDESFQKAAQFWFECALEMRRPGEGVAGFRYALEDGWLDAPGMVEGAAGIALALLAAVTPFEPEWDRMLLVSVPALTSSLLRNE